MTRWTIDRIRHAPWSAGSDCEDAYVVHFDSGPEPHVIVEYAAGGGGRHASEVHTRRMVRPYLDDEHPPRRILIDRDGNPSPR